VRRSRTPRRACADLTIGEAGRRQEHATTVDLLAWHASLPRFRGAQISRYRAQFARNIDVQTSFSETLLLSLVDADNDDHNADDREDKRKRRPRSAPPVDCFLLAASLADSAYADLPGDDRGDPSGPDIQNRMGNRPTAALIRPGDQTGEADAVGLDVLDIDHLQLRWLGGRRARSSAIGT
jgi:hypothetical protein